MFGLGDLPAGTDRGFPQSIGAEQPEQKRLMIVFVRRVHHAVGETGRRVRSVAEQFLDWPRLGSYPWTTAVASGVVTNARSPKNSRSPCIDPTRPI